MIIRDNLGTIGHVVEVRREVGVSFEGFARSKERLVWNYETDSYWRLPMWLRIGSQWF